MTFEDGNNAVLFDFVVVADHQDDFEDFNGDLNSHNFF